MNPCASRTLLHSLMASALIGALFSVATPADWPTWRGPARDGMSSETGWLKVWPESGPKKLWTMQVGAGYSAVAVKGNRVYTMGATQSEDTVWCLNSDTGEVLWKHTYAHPQRFYGADPMPIGATATPVLDGDRVFTLSREAVALCLDAATGKEVWQQDLIRESGGLPPRWAHAGSPLIQGNLAIYNVSSAGVALDKATGKVVWKSEHGIAGYSTPVPFAIGQHRGVAFFTAAGVVAADLATGKGLWQHEWRTPPGNVNAADPVFVADKVFISSGYNRGCALLQMSGAPRAAPQVVWENKNMKTQFNTCVLIAGHLYGNDSGTLKCLDVKTGEETWQMRGMGLGGLTAADGHLIVLTERGLLSLVKASPDKFSEVASAPVVNGRCFTSPVLANGRIYCRSLDGQLVCVDVRK